VIEATSSPEVKIDCSIEDENQDLDDECTSKEPPVLIQLNEVEFKIGVK